MSTARRSYFHFENIFVSSMNAEVVHTATAYRPLAHYLSVLFATR
jgi:hypothetical protein